MRAGLWLLTAAVALGIAVVVTVTAPQLAQAYPVTSIFGVPAGWSPTDVTFTLGTDQPPGSVETWYALDGGLAQPYPAVGVTVSREGTTSVVYWSRDGHSAFETPGTATVRIDKTPPVTTIAGVPDGWTSGGTFPLRLDAADALSGVAATYYRIDGGEAMRLIGPSLPVVAQTTTWVDYWSSDVAGNIEAPKTAAILVDAGVPATTVTGLPADWSRGPVTLTLTASAPRGTVAETRYGLDSTAPLATYSGPVTVSREGVTTMAFWSADDEGRREATRTVAVRIDGTPPVSSAAGLPSTVCSTAVGVSLGAGDALSGVSLLCYRIDGGEATVYGGPVSLFARSGALQLEWWAVDVAGNQEAHHHASVAFDAEPPITTCDARGSYVGSATVHLSATDRAAGTGLAAIYHRLDGAAPEPGDVCTVAGAGAHTLEYWSVDEIGNVEAHHWTTFVVTSPPVVDTEPPRTVCDARATYASSALVHLAAIDAGSGVVASWHQVDGAPAALGDNVTVTGVGPHVLRFWSVDAAGNVEPSQVARFTIVAAPRQTGVGAPGFVSRVHVGRSFAVHGHVARGSAVVRSVTINCYRRQGGRWVLKSAVRASLRRAPGGWSYAARVRLRLKGSWRLRALCMLTGEPAVSSAYRSRSLR